MASLGQSLGTVNRVFVKRTRRGQVKTFVRQQYLRDDLPTGSPYLDEPHLEPRLMGSTYLLLDTNVVLHQINLLERPVLRDVIILQTVLDEVRHNKVSVHKRLRALVDDASRRFHVFCNESHRETFTRREAGESPNDRNDRAIRAAGSWYASQLGPSGPKVLLLTNDRDNLRKAVAAGLDAQVIHSYVRGLPEASELQDLLALPPDDSAAAETPDGGARMARPAGRYAAHLSMSEMTRGLQAGELHQGKLKVNRHNPSRASVLVQSARGAAAGGGTATELRIVGRQSMNRALEGDVVVVRVLPRAEWSVGGGRVGGRNASGPRGKDKAPDEEDELAQPDRLGGVRIAPEMAADADEPRSGGDARPCAAVVGVVKRERRTYPCVLDPDSAIGSQHLAEPLDARVPKINITTRQADMLANKIILVTVDSWEPNHRFPTGHYVRTLGAVGDTNAESEAILIEHEVNCAPFSPDVQSCLPAKGWTIPDDEIARRLDLREGGPTGKVLVCSVDPPGCVDIDDALHAFQCAPGRYQVGVHIADVGHFIKAGTAIDREAASRATTVYLVNRRIDMVPKRLGEDLCSLHEKVDRLAFSCIWEVDEDANILSTRYEKTVIRSKGALSYDEAQLRLDDDRLNDPLTLSLRTLNALARKLRAKRMAAGALVLGSPEVRFVLDSESSDPTDVGIYKHKEANSMVEEFMLLANCSVAAAVTRAFPQCAMLRRHPPPTPGSFDALNRSLAEHGFTLDDSSSHTLGQSLDACTKPADPYFNQLARIMATRSMNQARYFSSGALPPAEYTHYGLACPIYTHFTSPIRRYADQMVHRLLAAIIGWEGVQQDALDPNTMAELTDNLNHRHTMAQYAGRASAGFHTLLYFRGRDVEEDAYIIKVRENGVVVLVPRYGIEGVVFVCGPHDRSPFEYDQKHEALQAAGCRLAAFDKVRVSIRVNVDKPHKPKLELAIVHPKLPGAAPAPA